MLMDMANSSVASRVRTLCNYIPAMNLGTMFPTWACEDPPEGEVRTQGPPGPAGDYTPISVGALFGAR
jgi:hypothetical protein